jgi:hypothetical protein
MEQEEGCEWRSRREEGGRRSRGHEEWEKGQEERGGGGKELTIA